MSNILCASNLWQSSSSHDCSVMFVTQYFYFLKSIVWQQKELQERLFFLNTVKALQADTLVSHSPWQNPLWILLLRELFSWGISSSFRHYFCFQRLSGYGSLNNNNNKRKRTCLKLLFQRVSACGSLDCTVFQTLGKKKRKRTCIKLYFSLKSLWNVWPGIERFCLSVSVSPKKESLTSNPHQLLLALVNNQVGNCCPFLRSNIFNRSGPLLKIWEMQCHHNRMSQLVGQTFFHHGTLREHLNSWTLSLLIITIIIIVTRSTENHYYALWVYFGSVYIGYVRPV